MSLSYMQNMIEQFKKGLSFMIEQFKKVYPLQLGNMYQTRLMIQ